MTDLTDSWGDECARCGSSVLWEPCATCEACGDLDHFGSGGHPDCPTCAGHGSMATCLSTPEWCEANPLPGREDEARHAVLGADR